MPYSPASPAAPDDAASRAQFVDWFRAVAPYIHAFKRKVFVIAFPGEMVQAGKLTQTVQDVALLRALGIRVVVVHGCRPQIEEQLRLRNAESRFHAGRRITDDATLECAKEASGEIRLDIEAAFSQGLANTPMANADIRVMSGNFVTAKPVGVVDGVDYEHTGVVRKIAIDQIQLALNSRAVVLLSPLGFSPTGEAFNLSMEDVATSIAIALRAEKLIFLTEIPGVVNELGELIREISERSVKSLLATGRLEADTAVYLQSCLRACEADVPRAHMIPFSIDGAALLEVFTHDGVGTMVSRDDLEFLREAGPDDVGAILTLIEPLEADGTLVPRGRGVIERDISAFSIIEHDRRIFGCAALHAYPDQRMGEMACLTVLPDAQGMGDGERLLKHIEQRAREEGLNRIFVLTTRTAHWFLKRGFVQGSLDSLPPEKQRAIDRSRNSQVYIKQL
ncbi:amino-acid N-acetyltransferase [Derxia lacustris]|uniref:amino-acid N-acetyltransferase n=1 Tax=Derxia lacustris TaxID=764842 RepID=UPI0015937264|nr:amino-acid N-acetyltransferase [Derxia lacustris]